MPHDYLVHYVMTQRASRPISGPKVVASIIRDARYHWEAGVPLKSDEPAKITKADIQRAIQEERAERKRIEAQRKGKP